VSEFSIDDLKSALGHLPGEPPAPNRGVAVRRRARVIRQRRSAAGAVAVALPVVGLSIFRGDPGRTQGDDIAAPFITMSVEAVAPTQTSAPVTTAWAPTPPAAAPTATAAAPKRAIPVKSPTATPTASERAKPTTSTEPEPLSVPLPEPTKTKTVAPKPTTTTDPVIRRPGPGLRVRLAASKTTVKVGERVDFTAVWSDTDGIYVGYELSYGDIGASKTSRVQCTGGVQPSGNTVSLSHAWRSAGTYRVDYAIRTCNGAGKYEDVSASVVVTVVSPEPTATPTPTPPPTPTPTPTPAQSTAPTETPDATSATDSAAPGSAAS
jgi:hypothetical protein